jgi:hypothetical protein
MGATFPYAIALRVRGVKQSKVLLRAEPPKKWSFFAPAPGPLRFKASRLFEFLNLIRN